MHNLQMTMLQLSDNMVRLLNETLGIWYLIILNAFGVIAVVVKVSELQLKRRKNIMIFALIANISWIFYFGLQGGFTSSVSFIIMTFQVIIFSMRNTRKWANSKFWLFFFIVMQLIMCSLTLKSWIDIFPTSAGVISVFAYYVIDERRYRFLIFIYILLWVITSVLNLYIVSMISDSVCAISAIIALIRYNFLNVRKAKRKEINVENSNE